MQRSEDLLLGKVAIQEGCCTQQQIDECLKIQSMDSPPAPLGDILLFKGYLTAVQLKGLLSRQHKMVMACPRCRLSFTVLTLSEGKSARCPRCKDPLGDPAPGGSTRTDAEITTQRLRVVPTIAPAAPQAARRIKMVCVICDQAFEWTPDATGRVRCPSCHSTFASRK